MIRGIGILGAGGIAMHRQLDTFLRGKKALSLATGEEALASLWIAEKIIDPGPEGKMVYYR